MSTASTDDEPEMVHIGAEVPPELKQRVRVAAAKRDESMSAFLRDVLDDVISDE